jgi:predicted GNAT family acetyltransferase
MSTSTLELDDVKTTPISLEETIPLKEIISVIKSYKTKTKKYYFTQYETPNFSNLMVDLYFRFKDRISENYRTNYTEITGMTTDVLISNNKEEHVTLYKVAPTTTIILQKNYIELCRLTFSPHHHNTIELSNIVIPNEFRGLGFGTDIMNEVIQSVKETNNRLYLFPGVTSLERRNGLSPDVQVPKLREWYSRLGFFKCLPEYMEITAVNNQKKETVGVSGYMVIN